MTNDSQPEAEENAMPPEWTSENFGDEFAPRPRVLVADDDELFGGFLTEFFRREGCQCDRVLDAESASRQLGGQEYDLLVSDIFMPGNVRLELIEQLPQIAAGLPVILLTGRPTVETAARSVKLAVVAYMTKPPDLRDLRHEARQAILRNRNLRTVARGRTRIGEWESSLAEVESMLRQNRSGPQAASWNRYLSLTLKNLLMTLLELKQISENVALADVLGPNLQRAELLTALQKTISVLRTTRQHFKSKDLGDLRHDLEALLGQCDSAELDSRRGRETGDAGQ